MSTRHRHVKLINAGADGPEPVRCEDCGWTGRRVYPKHAAFQPTPCPTCGSRSIVLRARKNAAGEILSDVTHRPYHGDIDGDGWL